jgi:hypothetical protein
MKGHNKQAKLDIRLQHFFHSGFMPLDVFKNPNFSVSIQQPEYPFKKLCEIWIVLVLQPQLMFMTELYGMWICQ